MPDLNLGTADGASCHPALRRALAAVLAAQTQFTQIVDGRYGQPGSGVHAVQLEMCWRCYMAEAPPFAIDAERAARVLPLLRQLVVTMLAPPAA